MWADVKCLTSLPYLYMKSSFTMTNKDLSIPHVWQCGMAADPQHQAYFNLNRPSSTLNLPAR